MMSFMASTGIIVGLVLLINLFIPVKENILSAFNIVSAISNPWFFISYRVAVTVYQKTGYYLRHFMTSGVASPPPFC